MAVLVHWLFLGRLRCLLHNRLGLNLLNRLLLSWLAFRCLRLVHWHAFGLLRLFHGSFRDRLLYSTLRLRLFDVCWLVEVAVSALRSLIHLVKLSGVAGHVQVETSSLILDMSRAIRVTHTHILVVRHLSGLGLALHRIVIPCGEEAWSEAMTLAARHLVFLDLVLSLLHRLEVVPTSVEAFNERIVFGEVRWLDKLRVAALKVDIVELVRKTRVRVVKLSHPLFVT